MKGIKTYITLLISVLTVLTISCSEKQLVNDADTLQLKGAVASIEEEFYYASYSFDKIELNQKLYKRYYVFDTCGRYAEFLHVNVFFAPNTQTKHDTIAGKFEHDSVQIEIDSINALSAWRDKEYTEPDYIREEYKYINDSVYMVSRFNKQGYLTGYDDCRKSNGKLTLIKSYSSNDNLLSKTDYMYDAKQRLIEKSKYFEKTSYKTYFKYNLGRKYETHSYTAQHAVLSFNQQGLVGKQKIYVGDTHQATIHYSYNKFGNFTKIKESNKVTKQERETSFNYKYDEYGNWQERIEKRNDGNIFVTRRLISYY